MTRTWDESAAAVAVESCPVCESTEVGAAERDWFVLELDRGDEVRLAAGEVEVLFACRACGSHWH